MNVVVKLPVDVVFTAATTWENTVPVVLKNVMVTFPRADCVEELLKPEPVTVTESPGIPRVGLRVIAEVIVNCRLVVLGMMSCTIMKCGPAIASGIVTLLLKVPSPAAKVDPKRIPPVFSQ